METKAYCEECNEYVDYTIKEELIKLNIDNIKIEFNGIITSCKQCNAQVLIEEYDDENIMKGNAIYKRKLKDLNK